ncbi:MAG: hypothetical protein C4527_12550 [Candidatus Omnitrophota bacterium]|jgi:hypothetical protein|nr:MAG: hypothetical protein C4527_12550 [Candidatus Omnitrophota bacterium]
MIYEFALEPDILYNWDRVRYFTEKFGIEHGRLISKFPSKKWKKMVFKACKHCPDREKKRIEVCMRKIESKLLKSHRDYDPDKLWLENAELSHMVLPFHAILACENPRSHDYIILPDEIDEIHPHFKIQREIALPRNAESMLHEIENLLSMSKDILFIDPHFDPSEERWCNLVIHCLRMIEKKNLTPLKLEYHCKEKGNQGQLKYWKNSCDLILSKEIPKSLSLKIYRWRQKIGGEKLHRRYILTDCGGIRFETGLDEGDEGETQDVSLLSHDLYETVWSWYQENSNVFEFVDTYEIISK